MMTMHRGQMTARGMATEYERCMALLDQEVEQASDLAHNLRHRRRGRQRVFRYDHVHAAGKRSKCDESAELFIAALPVTAVNKNESWRGRLFIARCREEVETLAGRGAVPDVEFTGMRCVEGRAAGLEVGWGIAVAIGCVEGRAVHGAPRGLHAVYLLERGLCLNGVYRFRGGFSFYPTAPLLPKPQPGNRSSPSRVSSNASG